MQHNSGQGSNVDIDRRWRGPDGQRAVDAPHQSLIGELEIATRNSNISARAEILRRVTDLFMSGLDRFNTEQRELFDIVMSRLVDEIDEFARAEFGERLAAIINAPPKVSYKLAFDDLIEVAGPLLSRSDQLDDDALIASAKLKSQEHLLAISQRATLSEGVTDILVERGNHQVVVTTAENFGARFSHFGYSTLVTRSKDNDELALAVWSRPEIPRYQLLALFERASAAVRFKFEAADRRKAFLVRDMIKQASDRLQSTVRQKSARFTKAHAEVQSIYRSGELTEDRVSEFAQGGKFDETAVALSLLSDLPIGAVERALVHDNHDQILVLAKSIGLSWPTASAILAIQPRANNRSARDLAQSLANFNKLKPETAKTAIQFYRLRERAAKAPLT